MLGGSNDLGNNSVCFKWYGELIDTVVYNDGGSELYVWVDAIELGTLFYLFI